MQSFDAKTQLKRQWTSRGQAWHEDGYFGRRKFAVLHIESSLDCPGRLKLSKHSEIEKVSASPYQLESKSKATATRI